jgi:dolichyl-phosphate-mannose-protein mannosyltransferase
MKRLLTPELLALTALSALSHFWRLFWPNAVLFDEKHYKGFAGHYFTRTFYVDVHPPLVNLLYAAVARLARVGPDALLGPTPVPVLRVLPAVCGTLIIPLGYLILRELDASRRVATLGAFALLCENALLVDTRMTFVEPVLICTGLAAVAAYVAARRRSGGGRLVLIASCGVLAGLSLSAKWTGASALGVVLAACAFDACRPPRAWRRPIAEGALVAALAATVYVAVFAVHFAFMTRSGTGQAAMSVAFRRTLIGEPQYDPAARMSLLAKMRDVHRVMRSGNRALEGATHAASSPWYTWPIMKHPIGLWENAAEPGRIQFIILLGNPVVWWGGLAGAVLAIVLVARRRVPPDQRFGLGLLGGAYLLNIVPFAAISRTMFIYHYLFAVVWLTLLSAYAIGIQAGWNEDSDVLFRFASTRSRRLYVAVVALILVGFTYFLPFSYGWTLSQRGFDNRFWVLHPGA